MASSLKKLAIYLPRKTLRYWTVASPIIQKQTETSCTKRVIIHTLTLMTLANLKKRSSHQETNEWKDALLNGAILLTEKEWNHAQKVYARFNCANLGDYHDLYLKTDILMLACVVEKFRTLCYNTIGLDSAQYFTCSHLSGDAFLKKCRADIKLLTDREHLETVENMIRGGVASVFDKKFFKANNRYVADHNKNDYRTYRVLLDANNLYGGIM